MDMIRIKRLLRNMSAGPHLWAELARYLLFVLPSALHHSHAAVLELAKPEGLNGNCFT